MHRVSGLGASNTKIGPLIKCGSNFMQIIIVTHLECVEFYYFNSFIDSFLQNLHNTNMDFNDLCDMLLEKKL